MSAAVASTRETEPLIVHVGRDGNGATFAMDSASRRRLAEILPGVRVWPRLFLAHEHEGDFARLGEAVQAHVLTLLTGVSGERLASLGSVVFMDPVSEEEIATWPRVRR